ncbi:MAG: hypothetical protein OFPI_23040 [Osedax symbiont Rs2]|nr:MAG: hypothetical protein OFPI_23040 [Osedax symbiont Rs2]
MDFLALVLFSTIQDIFLLGYILRSVLSCILKAIKQLNKGER